MTELREELRDVHPARARAGIALALAAAVPGVVLRLSRAHVSDPLAALLFGLAIVGAAFLLSWAAEVAQLDISAGLAIALLALIAVLPEYAVDFVFARKGGNDFQLYGEACKAAGVARESNCSLALANMTGANRLLIGVGWSLVVFIAWYRSRRAARPTSGIALSRPHAVELSYLALATAYSLLLPLKRSITLVDAAVLVGIFAAYTYRVARAPAEEPHLVGPARYLGTFTTAGRRASVAGLFVLSGLVIVLVAERFAEALVGTGEALGISEFLLVQWLAPLASEAPELLVATLFAWRLNTDSGLGTLVSSKVNQWTLLVGTLPIVFAVASGGTHGLPIDVVQREEILLTGAQSFLAVAVLANLSISELEAAALFGLFWAQFLLGAVLPERLHGLERLAVSAAYLALGAAVLVRDRGRLSNLLRAGLAFAPAGSDEGGRSPARPPGGR